MQVAKKIPFEDPNVLNACRAAYVISNILILFVYLYIQSAVNKKKGKNLFSFSPLRLSFLYLILDTTQSVTQEATCLESTPY